LADGTRSATAGGQSVIGAGLNQAVVLAKLASLGVVHQAATAEWHADEEGQAVADA